MQRKTKLSKDQRGLASILVTLIIMLIISLIVVGFARLSRREQRQSLDDQLSTQAFYAAESGVNDTLSYLKGHSLLQEYNTNCNDFIDVLRADSSNSSINVLNAGAGVQYSCLLINRALDNLTHNNISTDRSTVVLVKPQSGTLSSITIAWQDATDPAVNNTFCASLGQFPPANQWAAQCKTGIVRADILPGAGGNRSQLSSAVMTAYLFPTASATKNPLTYARTDSGAISGGNCSTSTTPYCSVTINFSSLQSQVYLRLKSIYLSTAVTITAKRGGTILKLVGDQALVDVTGKANDVLRRIQVRVPLNGSGPYPEFAIQSADTICKRIQIDQPGGRATNSGPPGVASCEILAR